MQKVLKLQEKSRLFVNLRDVEVAGSNPVASMVMTKSGNTEFYRVLALFSFIFFRLDLSETGEREKEKA